MFLGLFVVFLKRLDDLSVSMARWTAAAPLGNLRGSTMVDRNPGYRKFKIVNFTSEDSAASIQVQELEQEKPLDFYATEVCKARMRCYRTAFFFF